MYSTLPLELRDEIYAYLIDSPGLQYVNGPENRRRVNHPEIKSRTVAIPSYFEVRLRETQIDSSAYGHWWYHTYTGQHVDREIAALWYRTRTFRFDNAVDKRCIQRFRQVDVFDKRLVPGNLVQRIEVAISEEDVATASARKKLQLHLDALEGIGNKNVWLKLEIPNDRLLSGELLQTCVDSLRPTVRRLRKKGLTRVRVWQRGDVRLGWQEKDCTELYDKDPGSERIVKANNIARFHLRF